MKTILLLEKATCIRDNISELLELYNYNVIAKSECDQGYKYAIDHNPDLVIYDSWVGDRYCLEILRLLKNNLKTNKIPVLVTSANAEKEHKFVSYIEGAEMFLLKPYDTDMLLAKICRVLAEDEGNLFFAA